MRLMACSATLLFLAGLTACGGELITADSGKLPKDAPPLTAEVTYTSFTKDPLARFVVEFKNTGDKTRVGVKATWKALDRDGAIVGSYDKDVPPIGPSGTVYYVGGAGGANLNGVPARIKVEVTDEGEAVSEPEPNEVKVGKVSFKKAEFNFNPGMTTYDATMVVTALRDLDTSEIDSAFLLRGARGKILGAEWGDAGSAPAKLSKGENVVLKASIDVKSGSPNSVEGYAWE